MVNRVMRYVAANGSLRKISIIYEMEGTEKERTLLILVTMGLKNVTDSEWSHVRGPSGCTYIRISARGVYAAFGERSAGRPGHNDKCS